MNTRLNGRHRSATLGVLAALALGSSCSTMTTGAGGCDYAGQHNSYTPAAVGASRPAGVQERPPQEVTLSLSEGLLRALASNEQVRGAREEVEKARGRITEARATGLPKLDFLGRYKRDWEVPSITVGGTRVEIGEHDNYTLEADLEQPLYLGGKIGGALRVARLFSQYASEGYRGSKQAVIAQVTTAYYQVLLQQEYVLTAEQSLELSKKNLEDVERQFRVGMAAEFDRLRAGVQVANFKAELIRARNALHLAQVELLRIIGLPQDTKLLLTDELSYVPVEADFASSLEQALQLRPELEQGDLTIRMQKENVKLTKADLKPSVRLLGTYDWTKPYKVNPTENGWDDQLSAQLKVTFPLFDGFRTKGRVVQEQAVLRQYQLQLSALRKQVERQVRESLLGIQDSRELIESQRENVKQAEESLRLARVGYEQGVNKQIDVLDAQVARAVANRNYASAVHAHMLAELKLRQATGRLAEPEPQSSATRTADKSD